MSDPIDDPEFEAPPGLQRDLRALFGRRIEVPDSIGAALHAAARRRRRPLLLRPLPMAAAATVLVALSLAIALQQRAARSVPIAREDYDHDGRVDVLDAFRLALDLERGRPVDPAFDLDGDGRVDRRDVDQIAARAVHVGG